MPIKKVRYQIDAKSKSSLCIVDDLSDDLKQIIRQELAKVCHGVTKAASGRKAYTYAKTLREFIKRYHDKSPTTKLGMIGELLSHLLLFNHRDDVRPVSPFFNMEEASIKKGFDLLLTGNTDNSLWIVEVKSGELGRLTKEQKVKSLIDKARDDLIERIGSDNTTIWHTAINNVELALESGKSEKKILIDILEDCLDSSEDAKNSPSDMNVVLIPVLFEATHNEVDFENIKARSNKFNKEKIFACCDIFAIQKSTIQKIEDFLYAEAAGST